MTSIKENVCQNTSLTERRAQRKRSLLKSAVISAGVHMHHPAFTNQQQPKKPARTERHKEEEKNKALQLAKSLVKSTAASSRRDIADHRESME